MGHSKILNHNHKWVYACEAGRLGCTDYPARGHRCPHGYCQTAYFCESCWAQIKASWRGAHATCKRAHEKYREQAARRAELLERGAYVRIAAVQDNGRVKAWFKNGAGEEAVHYMASDTYRAIPLNMPATPEDYKQYGKVYQD